MRALAFLAASAVFVALAYPCGWLDVIVQQEVYRLCEATGILSRGARLWGQIGGMNVGLYEPIVHESVRALGAMLGLAPAAVAGIGVYARVRSVRDRRARPLRAGAAAGAVIAFGVALAAIDNPLGDLVDRSVFLMGKAAGCTYAQSGGVFMTKDGPFIGDGRNIFFNLLWNWFPWATVLLAAWVPALSAAMLLHRRAWTRRPGTCAACGYSLEGLAGAACPECGAARP